MMLLDVAHTATMMNQTATIAHAAVPIVPILLLPFILIFFAVIFPLWMLSLGALGLVLLLLRGAKWLVHRGRPGRFDRPVSVAHRMFRWVLTFGGFTERGQTTK